MARIQFRRGTAAQWTTANPVLGAGEPGLETDTKRRKTGDGTTTWTSLPYSFDGTDAAAAYTSKYASLLRQLPKDLTAPLTLTATAPTITVTAGGTTTISSGVQRMPKPAAVGGRTSQALDLTGDAHFRYLGMPAGSAYGSTAPDYDFIRPPLLTGGAGQAAFWGASVRFHHYGRYVEFPFKAIQSSVQYRLKVDGKYVTENMQTITQTTAAVALSAGSVYLLKFDFGTAAHRLIEYTFDGGTFGGVWVEPSATVGKGPKSAFTLMGFGDSITGGANGVARADTYPRRLADLLGCDEWFNAAIGGTGFLTTTGSDYRSRIGDISSVKPDILVIQGGQNDGSQTASALQAEVSYILAAIASASPSTRTFMWGEWSPGTPTTARVAFDVAERAACAAAGVPYISMIDPTDAYLNAPAWAASTTYHNGFVVTSGGVPYANITPAADATFIASKWRATSWIYGSGKVGTAANDGNADLYISNDGLHPSQAGHDYIARRLAAEIVAKVRALVPATTPA